MYDLKPHLMPKMRSDHFMASAAGVPCTIRIANFYPGYGCADPSTSVMCHLPVDGKGTSSKVTDFATAIGCKHCHDILDQVDWKRAEYIMEKYPAAVMQQILKGHIMTMTILYEEGLIAVPGASLIYSGEWR